MLRREIASTLLKKLLRFTSFQRVYKSANESGLPLKVVSITKYNIVEGSDVFNHLPQA